MYRSKRYSVFHLKMPPCGENKTIGKVSPGSQLPEGFTFLNLPELSYSRCEESVSPIGTAFVMKPLVSKGHYHLGLSGDGPGSCVFKKSRYLVNRRLSRGPQGDKSRQSQSEEQGDDTRDHQKFDERERPTVSHPAGCMPPISVEVLKVHFRYPQTLPPRERWLLLAKTRDRAGITPEKIPTPFSYKEKRVL